MPGPGSCLTGHMQRIATQWHGKAGQASVVLTLHAGEVRGGGQSGQGQGCMGAAHALGADVGRWSRPLSMLHALAARLGPKR